MKIRRLSQAEAVEVKGGEAITLSAVMALMAIAIIAIVCYRIFMGKTGKVNLPGGFVFQWD
jgi:hypothetical protein